MNYITLPALLLTIITSIASSQCTILPVTNAGGSGEAGYMFDMVNLSASPISTTGFAIRGLGNQATTVNVYSLNTTGSFLTSTTNFNQAWSWTLRGSAAVTLNTAANVELPMPLSVSIAPSTFRVENDSTTGIVRIMNIAQCAQATIQSALIGISRGAGATNPGQAPFSNALMGVTTNATDMLFNLGAAGTLVPGLTFLTFAPNAFGNYDWRSQ